MDASVDNVKVDMTVEPVEKNVSSETKAEDENCVGDVGELKVECRTSEVDDVERIMNDDSVGPVGVNDKADAAIKPVKESVSSETKAKTKAVWAWLMN
jgi:hypothetical protein